MFFTNALAHVCNCIVQEDWLRRICCFSIQVKRCVLWVLKNVSYHSRARSCIAGRIGPKDAAVATAIENAISNFRHQCSGSEVQTLSTPPISCTVYRRVTAVGENAIKHFGSHDAVAALHNELKPRVAITDPAEL